MFRKMFVLIISFSKHWHFQISINATAITNNSNKIKCILDAPQKRRDLHEQRIFFQTRHLKKKNNKKNQTKVQEEDLVHKVFTIVSISINVSLANINATKEKLTSGAWGRTMLRSSW